MAGTIVLGVGNEAKGDDGVGVMVARMLKDRLENARVIECGPVPENFWGVIEREDPDRVIIVDVIDFGGEPGEARVYRSDDLAGTVTNTHSLPLWFFVESLGERDVVIVGVQPESLNYDTSLSESVRKRLEEVASLVEELATRQEI